ncbi:MAG: hypothetical protein JXA20_15325 [Spirochaetes bacterium]|nr:hypothetical protein [Spirochaetota bacterium]
MKLVGILLLLLFTTGRFIEYPAASLLAIPALLLLAYRTGTTPVMLARKNIFILGFTFLYLLFALASALPWGMLPPADVPIVAARILLVYNAVLLSGRWLGVNGMQAVVRVLPSASLRLFLLMFLRTFGHFSRSIRTVADHVRCRLAPTPAGKVLVARYYLQNLMEKELYAYRYHQAAAITRITTVPEIYVAPEPLSPWVVAIPGFIALTYALAVVL